jgi:pimeloyl-ACP methyl ester carboxylesterase
MAKATLPLTRHLPTTWILSALRSEMERGYTQESRGVRSMDIYIRPFCSPEGRDVLVQHLEALDPEETVALEPRLGEIMAPTAVITGAHDPFITPGVAKQLHEAIPNSTLDVIPDVRHFTPEESPEAISTIMEQWLQRER